MEILKSRLTSVFQRKLKKQPGIKLHVYKRCGGVVWGFGFCFGNPHENFVPTEPLPSLSLRQRWWFDCNIFRFFSYPPLFCGFCIYYQYLSQLLNFMKSPETCPVLWMYLYPHTSAQSLSLSQHTEHLQDTDILCCRFSGRTASRKILIKSWSRSQVNGAHPKAQLYISATQKVYMVPHNANVTSQATVQGN